MKLPKYGQPRPEKYHSDIFNLDFTVMHNIGNSGFREFHKLPAEPKIDLQKSIRKFLRRIPKKNFNEQALDSPEFYQDPNYHQVYRFAFQPRPDLTVRLYSHDLVGDKLTNDYLDILEETLLLDENCDSRPLVAKTTGKHTVEEKLRKEIAQALYKGRALPSSGEQEFRSTHVSLGFKVMTGKVIRLFSTTDTLLDKGYPLADIFHVMNDCRVYPFIQYKNDKIVTNVLSSY